jgi:hypothetical protein
MTKFYDWMITRTIRCSGLHLHRPNTSTGSTPASAGTYSFKATPLDSQGPGGGPVYGYAQSRRRPGTNMVFVVPVAGSRYGRAEVASNWHKHGLRRSVAGSACGMPYRLRGGGQ